MDKAAIVIVHYKGEDDTRECVRSVLDSRVKEKQTDLIVVINKSDELQNGQGGKFAEKLKKDYPEVIIIENQNNTGYAQGNNIGIKKALDLGSNYILLLNNDTIAPPRLLEKLVEFSKSSSQIGLVSPKIYFAKGFEYHKNRYKNGEKGKVLWYAGGIIDWRNVYARHRGVDEVDKSQYNRTEETAFATGCCMLIKRETVKKAGFFDEKYFLYFEDIDLSLRVKKTGLKVVYYPNAFLWHKNASSSGKPGSLLHLYYQNRNRLYFGFKYAGFRAKKSLFLDSLKLFLKGGVYAKSITDYYRGNMGGVNL